MPRLPFTTGTSAALATTTCWPARTSTSGTATASISSAPGASTTRTVAMADSLRCGRRDTGTLRTGGRGRPSGMHAMVQGCAVALLVLLATASSAAEPVQGGLRCLPSRTDDADTPAREQHVRFFLAFPQRYHVVVTKPDDKESKTSFISDGTTRWELTQFIEGEAPDVKKAPVGGDDEFEQRLLACFRFDSLSSGL